MIDLSLYLVANRGNLDDESFLNLIKSAIKGGVSVVQLREKALNSREFYTLALRLKALCDEFQTPLIINDRMDIALAINAAGVHLGQEDLPVSVARRLLGENKIIGLSAKTLSQLEDASGADYVGCGAVFKSPTKDSSIIGVAGLNALCEKSKLPVVAIGGHLRKKHCLAKILQNRWCSGVKCYLKCAKSLPSKPCSQTSLVKCLI